MSSETNVPDTTQTDTGDVESKATDQLTPPSKTDGFKKQDFPSYSNASIPMPGEWAEYPAVLNWTIQVYAYKTDLQSKACIIMVHSGSVKSITAEVSLTHSITSVNNGSGSFVNHLARTNDGQKDGRNYRYTIDFKDNLNLVDKNSNPFEFSAVFQDEYTLFGFIQNGKYSGNEVEFSFRRAPLFHELDNPSGYYEPQIHGITEFKCDLKSSNKYDFELSFNAGSTPVTKNITVSL